MKTSDQAADSMVRSLPEKTGKSLEQWLAIVAKSGLDKHGAIVKHLKSDHGMTHGYANLVAHSALRSAAVYSEDVDLINGQYAGDKAGLKPVYDAVIEAVSAFGNDLEIAPKKAYVSLRRKKQFAIVQPSTKTRVDIGLNLKGQEAGERLEVSGSFNAMVSHRVRLSGAAEVDSELTAWLKSAYDQAG